MNKHLLFVYGSLLSGFRQPAYTYISRYFTLLGSAKVKGELRDMGTYPVALPTQAETYITGELYQLNKDNEYSYAFSQLDDYEGVNVEEGTPLYKREKSTVYLDNEQLQAWMYWFTGDASDKPVIASGNVADYFVQLNNHS